MARINIEDQYWPDPRRQMFCDLSGDSYKADGVFLRLIRIAQDYTKKNELIPLTLFKQLPFHEHLIAVGFCKEFEAGIYLAGTQEHLSWLRDRSEAGKKGGQSKSESKTKHLKQNRSKSEANAEANSKQARSKDRSKTETSPSPSPSPSKEETTTTTIPQNSIPMDLRGQLDEAWVAWNQTLTSFGLKPKNISPPDERTLAQAIRMLGLERVKNALVGKSFETKQGQYDPVNTLSLEYCLSRNAKTGNSNHERLENLALANSHVEQTRLDHERAEYIARYGSGSLAEDSP